MPTRCNRWYLLQILLHAQHVSGNTVPIIRSSRVLYRWSLPVVFGALVFRLSVWCGAGGYVSGLQAAACTYLYCIYLYNTLELLMMGIVLPETCWACNKICNKYNLLHLVGILFPHNITYFVTDTLVSNHILPGLYPAISIQHNPSWEAKSSQNSIKLECPYPESCQSCPWHSILLLRV